MSINTTKSAPPPSQASGPEQVVAKTSKTLFIKTYGCQSNVYDSERMMEMLQALGYHSAPQEETADLIIFNTCHIREKAEHKLFSDLGRFRRLKETKESQGKPCFLVVAGCTGQALGKTILSRAPYVSAVVGPQTYHTLPKILEKLDAQQLEGPRDPGLVRVGFPTVSKFTHLSALRQSPGPAAFLSIQEGCNKFCKFCVVPYTRGAEYSRPVEDILEEARRLVDQGVISITLLGQNVNAYHGTSALGETWSLGRLLFALADMPEIAQLRYSSSHPRDMHDALYDAHASLEKLLPILHLPVQSGSDGVLHHMNRNYTRDFYLDCIEKLRALRPGMAFSSDFIVGYPGETHQDFMATCDLVERVRFAQAYSFQYSPRPGTPAASYDQVLQEEMRQRLQHLQSLLNAQQLAFNKASEGTVASVLVERVDAPCEATSTITYWGRSLFLQSTLVEAPLLGGKAPPIKVGDIISARITRGLGKNLQGVWVKRPWAP